MNLKKKKGLKGAITVYVMMMFGLIIVLYLFGFTNPWNAYTADQNLPDLKDANGKPILDEQGNPVKGNITRAGGIGVSILDWMLKGIEGIFKTASDNWIIALVATITTIAGFWLISKVGGQYVLAYIVPIIILAIFANVFLFPTASLQGANIVEPFDMIVFTFLNLFLVLSYIEFVKGNV